MKRHNFDPLSFAFGLAFAVVSLALSVGGFHFGAPLRWVGAGFLLLLGILLLATSRTAAKEKP
jgi:hypothetical protein